jgi:hypothetical protein
MSRVSVAWLLATGTLILGFAPALKADVVPSPETIQRRLERLREQAAAVTSGARPAPSVDVAPSPSSSGSASAMPSRISGLQSDLLRKWAELSATRRDRRDRHRAEVIREVGQRLSDPAVKAELALHATRMAELGRAEFLAQNARTGAAREKLLARVAKLSERETARHRARLAKLLAAAPAASASASTAPSLSPPPSSGGAR